MLVLTRRLGEDILIDNGKIVIRVLQIDGTRVRLGVESPPQVDVHRREVYEQIQKSRRTQLDTDRP